MEKKNILKGKSLKREADYLSSILKDVLCSSSSSSESEVEHKPIRTNAPRTRQVKLTEDNTRKLSEAPNVVLKSKSANKTRKFHTDVKRSGIESNMVEVNSTAKSLKKNIKEKPDQIGEKEIKTQHFSGDYQSFRGKGDTIKNKSDEFIAVALHSSKKEEGLFCKERHAKDNLEDRESLYNCPEISLEILPKNIWYERIRHYIEIISESDEILAAIIAIKSLNSKHAAEECLDILESYLRNLMLYPLEDKYRQIKFENKTLQEKVLNVEGGGRFLTALGFNVLEKKSDRQNYFVYPFNINEAELLEVIDLMHRAEGFKLTLHRGDEADSSRQNKCLRKGSDIRFQNTKGKTRGEDSLQRVVLKNKNKPKRVPSSKYTQIKIRMPDGSLLQGTFGVDEKLISVKSFIEEKTDISEDYTLFNPPAEPFKGTDYEKTLEQLELFPAVLLNLKWEVSDSQKEKQGKLNTTSSAIKKPIKPKS